jgi:adenylate cyclase
MSSADSTEHQHQVEEVWRTYMMTGDMPAALGAPWYMKRYMRPIARWLPSDPRCRICDYPFHGLGGWAARALFGLTPSKMNPQLCNVCEAAADHFRGGAEIEMSLIFADVRGSTTIAENKSPLEFSRLIDRFYQATSRVLFQKNALLEKLIGDEVTGFFVPGIAGPDHARLAIEAGEEILRVTGHADPHGPWVPVGVGVHTGLAFVGAVGAAGSAPDISVLGDTVNTAARIASQAGAGELLFSDAAGTAAHIKGDGLEARHLSLKGRAEPIDVWVKKVAEPGDNHARK